MNAEKLREKVSRETANGNKLKNKYNELSKQMSVIMEMRNEKGHLQGKIQGMQNKVDYSQKELTGRPAPQKRWLMPELNDNAVMLTPRHQLLISEYRRTLD